MGFGVLDAKAGFAFFLPFTVRHLLYRQVPADLSGSLERSEIPKNHKELEKLVHKTKEKP